jgi:hypothetical protein
MSRIIDLLVGAPERLSFGCLVPATASPAHEAAARGAADDQLARLLSYAPRCVPVVADNVAAYIAPQCRDGFAAAVARLGSLKPPWPLFLVEARWPPGAQPPSALDGVIPTASATLVFALERGAEAMALPIIAKAFARYPDTRWLLMTHTVLRMRGSPETHLFAPHQFAWFAVGEDGRLGHVYLVWGSDACRDTLEGDGEDLRANYCSVYAFGAMIALMAISFCHTRGMVIADNAPPAREARCRRRRKRPPLVAYKTLEVAAGQGRVVRVRDGGGIAGPSLRGLTQIRGHDAVYLPEPGHYYMGRPHADVIKVFRPMHLAGDPRLGKVVKTYDVQPPEEDPPCRPSPSPSPP